MSDSASHGISKAGVCGNAEAVAASGSRLFNRKSESLLAKRAGRACLRRYTRSPCFARHTEENSEALSEGFSIQVCTSLTKLNDRQRSAAVCICPKFRHRCGKVEEAGNGGAAPMASAWLHLRDSNHQRQQC